MNTRMELESEEARQALIGRLRDIDSSEELFLACVRRACVKLGRYADSDKQWLAKWLPILLRQAA